MGRTAKPRNLQLLNGRGNGTDSGGRKVSPDLGWKREEPEMPEEVEWDATAKAEWERVMPELMRLSLVKPADGPVLAAYCLTWSRFVDAQMMVRTRGLIVVEEAKDGRETHKIGPWVTIARDAGRELRGLAAQFGFTPASERGLEREGDSGDGDNPFASGATG